ncbi:MAG: response regulator [Nitrospinae bacterium]|nr:response regulator [Nitrospinota bacterium]
MVNDLSVCNILVVDDDSAFCHMVEHYFSITHNLQIKTAKNGEIALELIQSSQIDIVLSDIEMPRMDGISLLKKVEELHIKLPFIFVTGHSNEGKAINAIGNNTKCYLKKPLDLDVLGETVINLWRKISLERELELARQREKEESAFVHDVMMSLNNAVIIFTQPEGFYLLNNRLTTFAETHSVSEDEILEALLSYIDKEGDLEAALKGDKISYKEVSIKMTGRLLHFCYCLKQIKRGGESQFLLSLADMTDTVQRRLVEEEFNKVRMEFKEKKEIYRMIIHDLKNPLCNITVNADLLTEFGELTEDQKSCHNLIGNEARNMQSMISYLLNMVKMEEISVDFDKEIIDITSLLDSRVKQFQKVADKKKITIRVNQPDKKLFVKALPLHVMSVFDNLISNAIKYSEQGEIEITAVVQEIPVSDENEECFAVITIKDSGIGISEEKLRMVFDPFFRVTHDVDEKGHGVGLSNAKKIIEEMGGFIQTESTLGVGTTFTVSFPLYSPLVLLIDNNYEELKYFEKQTGETALYDIKITLNIWDAFALIKNRKPDLILMDIKTSREERREFFLFLKEGKDSLDIPVINFSFDKSDKNFLANVRGNDTVMEFSNPEELNLWLGQRLFNTCQKKNQQGLYEDNLHQYKKILPVF